MKKINILGDIVIAVCSLLIVGGALCMLDAKLKEESAMIRLVSPDIKPEYFLMSPK
jgi:hypothetical protein